MTLTRTLLLLGALLTAACQSAPTPTAPQTQPSVPAPQECKALGEPDVLAQHEGASLVRWELPANDVWRAQALPKSPALARYRARIQAAGGDLLHPVADAPDIPNDYMREVWRREDHNRDLAYSGKAGRVRPVQCWEALMLARHFERVDPFKTPSEFIAAMTLSPNGQRVRFYFGAGTEAFPPKQVYPFEAVSQDVGRGWRFEGFLHNHTVRSHNGQPALGVPAPSTNDVMLSRGLVSELGMGAVWVTNGFYTADIPAEALDGYLTPPKAP